MTIIDLTLLVLLGGFVLAGFWFGLIHMVGSLIGAFLGAYIASRFYDPLAVWLNGISHVNLNLLRILSFLLVYVLINRLIGVLVALVEKIFRVVSVIPFMKTFNRLFGALLGLVEGVLVLGLVVYFAARFPVSAAYELMLRNSQIARILNIAGELMAPFVPKALRAIQSVL